MTTLLITIVPSLIILSFFFFSDKFKEPKQTIAIVFFLGILICLPAGIINDFMYETFNDGSDFSERLSSSFLSAAWSEELLKFVILYFIVLRRNEFNEPMDGIVYGVTVSLGFATFENYEYVYVYFDNIPPLQIAIVRALTAIPMHASCGIIMGCFLGMHVFRNSSHTIFKAIIYPILFHGTYNYLVGENLLLFLLFFVFTLTYTVYLYRKIRELQENKQSEGELKLN